MRGGGGTVVAVVALAGVAVFAWLDRANLPVLSSAFATKAPASAVPDPIPVTVVVAKEGDVPHIIAGIGIVSSLQSVTVRSRIDGEITSINFNEGQFVKAGDILAEIDKRQLQSALEVATAKKTQDQSLLDNARSDSQRYIALAQKGVVTPQVLDEKNALVKQLEAAAASDDASISSARTQLGYATIRAPISGRTGFRTIDKGGIVSQSSTEGIVTITQLDPIGVVFVAPGDRFGEIRDALKSGAPVEALSTDGTRVLARGQLTLMDNIVNSQNGSVKLKATFDNQHDLLWPGLPVATRLTVAVDHGVVVPDKSLSRGTDGLSAYVIGSDNKAVRRAVQISVVTDGFALVTKGIAANENVVYDGLGQITDAATVTIGKPPVIAPPAYAAQQQRAADASPAAAP